MKSDSSLINETISFQSIVKELNISEATVRNWVLTGQLKQVAPKLIDHKSYKQFKTEVIGKDKLNRRANKLHLDETDHAYLIKKIQSSLSKIYSKNSTTPETKKTSRLEGYSKFSGEEVSKTYENELGASHKNLEGIFYTPPNIVNELFSYLPSLDFSQLTFCDPCCGSGNFLVGALDAGISPENIYGFDTDPTAVEIAKARIFEKTGYRTKNIFSLNFLDYCLEKQTLFNQNSSTSESESPQTPLTFDIIFTNPPWGKKLPLADKKKYADAFNGGIRVDSAGFFSLACLEVLTEGGFIGFLLPESFFNVAAFSSVRKKLLEFNITHLIDHKKPFEKLQTRAQSFILKKEMPKPKNKTFCLFEGQRWKRVTKDFHKNPSSIFNFYSSDQSAKVIDHLFDLPHTTLKGQASWALGNVTGNNKKFLHSEEKTHLIPIYKGSDITGEGFKKPSHFITEDFSSFQQVAPIELYQAPKKIAYRFISSNLVFAYDNQKRYFLNSANLIIPHEDFDLTCEQITFLLNSEVMNWVFHMIFRTHKVLRSDLEFLPLWTDYFKQEQNPHESTLCDYLGIMKVEDGTFCFKK